MLGRALGIAIVFDGKENGQLPKRSDVHCLVDDALAECAVAEKRGGDAAEAVVLQPECRSGGDGRNASEYVVGEESSIAEVLGAANASADARRLSQDLADQAFQIAGECYVVAMTAMVRKDI